MSSSELPERRGDRDAAAVGELDRPAVVGQRKLAVRRERRRRVGRQAGVPPDVRHRVLGLRRERRHRRLAEAALVVEVRHKRRRRVPTELVAEEFAVVLGADGGRRADVEAEDGRRVHVHGLCHFCGVLCGLCFAVLCDGSLRFSASPSEKSRAP